MNGILKQNLETTLNCCQTEKVLECLKEPNPVFSFGGYGGVLKFLTKLELKTGVTIIPMAMTSDTMMLKCYQMEMYFLVWEEIDAAEATSCRSNFTQTIYIEKLIEVNPTTNQVEWEWRSWDHIVQEYDSNALNYGSVANNPQRININYNLKSERRFHAC